MHINFGLFINLFGVKNQFIWVKFNFLGVPIKSYPFLTKNPSFLIFKRFKPTTQMALLEWVVPLQFAHINKKKTIIRKSYGK